MFKIANALVIASQGYDLAKHVIGAKQAEASLETAWDVTKAVCQGNMRAVLCTKQIYTQKRLNQYLKQIAISEQRHEKIAKKAEELAEHLNAKWEEDAKRDSIRCQLIVALSTVGTLASAAAINVIAAASEHDGNQTTNFYTNTSSF